MTYLVRGVRSIELEVSEPSRTAAFFTQVWNLAEVERHADSFYFRGTGPYHHILAIHPAKTGAAVRRIVLDVADRTALAALHDTVKSACPVLEAPHQVGTPGGGLGFGFSDTEGRNYGAVCEVVDHDDSGNQPDRPRKIAHVNINSADAPKTANFLTAVLGFKLIDASGPLSFFHCGNTDHNSMVLAAGTKPTLNHIAFELPDLDSVMRGAGRMRDAGYPIEWGVGRHGAGNNVFAYFAGPEELPLEYTAEVLQIDETYMPHGPEYWRFPPGRMDQWGVTAPQTTRWKRIQEMHHFTPGVYRM
jgi:catechol 2,3-dioxygenase-like lactoylglutathione lyase family enzyme